VTTQAERLSVKTGVGSAHCQASHLAIAPRVGGGWLDHMEDDHSSGGSGNGWPFNRRLRLVRVMAPYHCPSGPLHLPPHRCLGRVVPAHLPED